jgi:hypothetical protein
VRTPLTEHSTGIFYIETVDISTDIEPFCIPTERNSIFNVFPKAETSVKTDPTLST